MKAARPLPLALLAISAAEAQLAVSSMQDVVRHPYFLQQTGVADLDGDGASDLLLQGGSHLTAWCRNLGDGTFANPAAIEMVPRNLNHKLPFLADLEGKGRDDLFLNEGETRTTNQGGGIFGKPEPLPGGTWPTYSPEGFIESKPYAGYITTFRKTGASKDSLLVAEKSMDPLYDEGPLSFYDLDAEGNPTFTRVLSDGEEISGAFYRDLRGSFPVIDLDRDGHLDLLFDYEEQQVYRNRGDDSFDAAEPLPLSGVFAGAHSKPGTVMLPGESLPALVRIETYYVPPEDPLYQEERIIIRRQIQQGTDIQLLPENDSDCIIFDSFNGYPENFLVIPAADDPDREELWVKHTVFPDESGSLPQRLQKYRFVPGTGWQKDLDFEIPGRGTGEIIPLTLVPGGPPGLACSLGSFLGSSGDAEDKVIWASLESLRAGTPDWRTIAGPFNDFTNFRVADLDNDGSPDLVSGERSHGLSGPKSGRVHLIHDITGEKEHQVLDIETTDWFGGAATIPGNLFAIGDADGDNLPDLAVSNGPADAIRLLKNLGGRTFTPPQTLATSSLILRPMRMGPGTLLYQDGGRVFSKDPAGGTPVLRYDLGAAASMVLSDMDGDDDADVVSSPCPLGNVTGWGKVGGDGTITSWHFLTTLPAIPIVTPGGAEQIGWITTGAQPKFQRIREGAPGIISSPLPPPLAALPTGYLGNVLWPPVDLDRDGDHDLLMLATTVQESLGGGGFTTLRWQENRGTHWSFHTEVLAPVWSGAANSGAVSIQSSELSNEEHRILFGNAEGEILEINFAAPIPGGPFGQWLDSFDLTGASAGAEADPDEDGLTNLEEALQGSSPASATSGGFSLPVSLEAPAAWTFSSGIDLAGSGVKIVAETSGDLEEWETLPGTPAADGMAGEKFLYRVADGGITAEPKRFVRFKFTWEAE